MTKITFVVVLTYNIHHTLHALNLESDGFHEVAWRQHVKKLKRLERIVTPATQRFGAKAADWLWNKNAPEVVAEN
jgi:hypothetical protein